MRDKTTTDNDLRAIATRLHEIRVELAGTHTANPLVSAILLGLEDATAMAAREIGSEIGRQESKW
jgi:hypothetical protein